MARPIAHQDDEQHIAALRSGDEQVFATLVDRHSPAMIRVALAYVPGRAVAEDVVQETWIAVMRGIDGSLEGLTEDSIPAEMRDGLIAAFRHLRNR